MSGEAIEPSGRGIFPSENAFCVNLFQDKIFINEKRDYNPIENEIVDEAEHYLYSSARDYAWFNGLLSVELLE